jgi:NAD(P)-dependent dehydrogenase (short-subunit alcohol dehydrogenase family)
MSKVLLVTGGSRGIGHSVSLGAAQKGWKVCVNFVSNRERADQTVELIKESGGQAIAVQADISEENNVVRLFEACEEKLGPVEGFVNSAGIVEPYGRIDELNYKELLPLIDLNVNAAIICVREAVKRMSPNHGGRGGSIVLVSSVSSRLGSPGMCVPYAASKGAVDSLGWGLAQEVAGEGIRVNVVSPGLIDTEIQPPGRVEKQGPMLPAGRVGQPEEVASAILWLLSDEASYVSGSNLVVSYAR